MDDEKARLEEKLKDLELRIEELNQRIPPHSVKPAMIMELDSLEEERDEVAERLKALSQHPK
jgi:hypothetical protein